MTAIINEIRIKQGNPAIGRSLAETGITTTEGATLATVSRGEQDYRFNPPPEIGGAAGDILVMLGNTQVIQALERRLSNQSIQP